MNNNNQLKDIPKIILTPDGVINTALIFATIIFTIMIIGYL